jgi:hypothetical protein
MSSSVAIVGLSGTGKSTSYAEFPELGIKGLNPKSTVIINVSAKDLPMRGGSNLYKGKISEGGNYMESSNAGDIAKVIEYINEKRKDITNIVIDDAQYIMAFEFMARAKETGYAKYSDLGVNINKVLTAARNSGQNLKIYFLWHPEQNSLGQYKMKTCGQLIDNYLTLEGLFTVILYSSVTNVNNKVEYQFITNNDGVFPAKSPFGMFKDLYIKNDLGFVSEKIDEYYSGEPEQVKVKSKSDILEV